MGNLPSPSSPHRFKKYIHAAQKRPTAQKALMDCSQRVLLAGNPPSAAATNGRVRMLISRTQELAVVGRCAVCFVFCLCFGARFIGLCFVLVSGAPCGLFLPFLAASLAGVEGRRRSTPVLCSLRMRARQDRLTRPRVAPEGCRAGATITRIRAESGAGVKVLMPHQLPPCALATDLLVEVRDQAAEHQQYQ